MHKIHNGLQNMPKFFLFFQGALAWACRLKPLLHGLNLSKSPIKNHATLFGLSRVIKPDQTKLGSTKPDRTPKPNRAPKPYYVVLQNN